MYVKVQNNEIVVGPQSCEGSGDSWYLYEGPSVRGIGLDKKIEISISGDIATGSIVDDPDASDFKSHSARSERDFLLKKTDWTQLPDSPLTDAQKAEWSTYRQSLRDVPQQSGFPVNVVWPTEPA
jgi:hypothetical protein